jgi:hypothetical protein
MERRHERRQGTWLRLVMTAVLALLAVAGPAAAGEPTPWAVGLAEARRRANQERKPILCVFLRKAHTESARLERSFEKSKLVRGLLDEFVCVKLDPAADPELVDKYHISLFPSMLFITGRDRPLKLVVGPVSTGKVRAQMKDVLAKFDKLKNPWKYVPKTRPKRPAPATSPEVPRLLHPSSCPDRCEHCAPAIDRALGWLVRNQRRDGSWRKLDHEVVTRNEDGKILTRSIDHIDVALTSLAGLALLAEGSTPNDGARAANLARAVAFVKSAVRADGVVSNKTGNDFLYLVHSTFETSLAAVFLAEVHKATPDRSLAQALAEIRDGLVRVQDIRSGGWGYGHDAIDHQPSLKRGWRLLATTHVAMTALNAIRDAGVEVGKEPLELGAKYVGTCLGRDGTFQYRTELRWSEGYPGATAGALFALSRSGVGARAASDPVRALHRRHFRDIAGFGEHWWFFLLFSALAMNDEGEGSWDAFHHAFRDQVLARQKENGSWDDPDQKAGAVFATAIAATVLQLGRGHLAILARRSGDRDVSPAAERTYLENPDPLSRVKVFERDGRYLVDLIVSTDGPANRAWFERMADGVRGANRMLFDVTDGQMSLHRVEIVGDKQRWDDADVRVTTDFHSDGNVPGGGAHGITMVAKRTEVRGGRETAGRRIGEWVKVPYYLGGTKNAVPWHNDGLVRVLAHELCHYLLGVQDEYGVGGTYCTCIVGDRSASELCNDSGHTDDRRELSCWAQARTLYPLLKAAAVPDPGPWDPPRPLIVLPQE